MTNSLFKFYLDVFLSKKAGILAYSLFRILYKTTEFVLPALLIKYIVGVLESKPVGMLTMTDVRPTLLLDEATSALDSETEQKIQDSLTYLMQNRTTIAVAHRLSTLKQMDRIIAMDKGRIVECGSHKQLLNRRGAYYKLWKMQYSGFL